jgi:hypothetical protein
MSDSQKNALDVIDDGINAAARAIGRAVGFFRRRDPRKEQSEAEQPKRTTRRRASTVSKASHDAGKAEISRIEAELDRVYGAIVAGAGAERVAGASTAASELNDLIMRARSLKDQLRERRLDLARLERVAARERQLRPSRASEPPPAPREPQRRREPERPRPVGALEREIERVQNAREGFADASDRLVFERLARNLADEDPEVRRTAAGQLGELGPPAVRVLSLAVDDSSERVRVAALNALARIGSPAASPLFRSLAADKNHHLRLASLRGLAKAGDPEANRSLVDALEDEHPLIRKTAATLLGWREVRTALRPLLSALRDEDQEVRAAAATSLGSLRDDRAVLSLIRVLLDDTMSVREAALAALRTITGESLEVDLAAVDEEQLAALKEWWRTARVDTRLGEVGGPALPEGVPAAKAVAAAPAPAKKPAKAKAAPAKAAPAAAAPKEEPAVAEPAVEEPVEEAPAPAEEYESLLGPAEEAAPEEAAAANPDLDSLLDASLGGGPAEGEEEGEGAGGEEYESLLDGDLLGGASDEDKAKS